MGSWSASSPLNATFIYRLTKGMKRDISLVERYNLLETMSSIATEVCNITECQAYKVCIIRSGGADLGRACPKPKAEPES